MSARPARATALISIGTNSTRLLVVDGPRTLAAQSVGTRLGTGLDGAGKLDGAARARTLEVIAKYMLTVRAHAATIDVIATSALRRAADAAAFSALVEELTGIAPRIISGDEEAGYSFLGATANVAPAERVGVLDVGGGSTELAVGTRDRIERTISLEIGAVRLGERFPALLGARALDADERRVLAGDARAAAAAILAPLAGFAGFTTLLAVGGTMFTAAAMVDGDAARDGVRITRGQQRTLIDALLARDLDARRAMAHIRPQRADILPAGLVVVDEACALLGIDALRVSHADLLAGYLNAPAYRGRAAGERGAEPGRGE